MNKLLLNVLAQTIDTGLLILIIVGSCFGLAILGVLYFLLDKYFLRKRRCKKTISNLEKNFDRLHTLLTSTDFQYIQKIDVISRTNLLYAEVYQNFLKTFKEIRDEKETSYQEVLNTLVHKLDEGDIKGFVFIYKDSKGIFDSYEEAVNNLNLELEKVIKPEEDARKSSIQLKDKYRDTKSQYNAKEAELSFVSETFIKVFTTIDERFKTFESLVSNADYEEAMKILPQIDAVLDVLNNMIRDVPALISRVENETKNNLDLLLTHYETLLREGYSLSNLNFDKEKEYIDTTLENVKNNIKNLKITSCNADLDNIDLKIKYLEGEFKKEEEAHAEFIENNDRIYNGFTLLEKEFIAVKNRLNNYTKYYLMDEDHKTLLRNIQDELNDVSIDKRKFDQLFRSTNKSPYSQLLLYMRNLENGTGSIRTHFDEFKKYLASLKDNVELCYKFSSDTYFELKENEETLRSFYNENLKIKLNPLIDECYSIIDNIVSLLKYIPIDVNKCLQLKEKLEGKKDILIKEINTLKENRNNSILLINSMNRERIKFSDINIQLSQAENLYLNGDYVGSYQMSLELQKKIAEKDKL